jgi:hydrogenase maturation protein HypF
VKLKQGAHIQVTGVVQGVGFRPFVYGLAQKLALKGWVRNTSAGVEIEVEGAPESVARFAHLVQFDAPPLARVESLTMAPISNGSFATFEIRDSQPIVGAFQPISADIGTCGDCLRELFDPADRRFRYPFINCTHCGPRFTIIKDIPYDRAATTMATFAMCAECSREYHDPSNRRFHAQPIACPSCGPQVWLEITSEPGRGMADSLVREAAIQAARQLLREGKIVAVKGLGGFHLACDATNSEAIAQLRRRKFRDEKPLAVMMWNSAAVARQCDLQADHKALLESKERPIVILDRSPRCSLPAELAPGQDTLGVMLPYAPLHYLLLEPEAGYPQALVLTSGNARGEPLAATNDEARRHLAALADAHLYHDRGIHARCDDSVVRILPRQTGSDRMARLQLRRARGYAPYPLTLPREAPPLLATGAELKNAFCLTRGRFAFLSQHIGDMDEYRTLCSFEQSVAHLEHLFRIQPEAIACDLHPDYQATRYALGRANLEKLPLLGVQHHHAHVASCLVDNHHPGDRPVIGVAFDGTGYGDDGTIWGGEFLLADYLGYQRLYHLLGVPLPGGDSAIKEPWRFALAWLHKADIAWEKDLPPVAWHDHEFTPLQAVRHQLMSGLNAPLTSSMGRLFDAVASLTGVRQRVNYEAQAAIELEALADPDESAYYALDLNDAVIDARPVFTAIVEDLRASVPVSRISARFHNGVARLVLETCRLVRSEYGVNEVALSGGVWQNMRLLTSSLKMLRQDGFDVLLQRDVPANDGGVALGQAATAACRLMDGRV